MTSANRQKWSHEAIRTAVGGPRGSVHHVMASLASEPLSVSESYAFCEIDFENDPLQPDWQNLEKEGILPTLREAKSRIYAEGSQGKIRTSLNRWMHFTATKARVSFIRPRVGDDPEAFMTESLLRQAFVADCASDGFYVETDEQYASLFNCWHIGTVGCGLVSSRSFEDEQFRRTNQGLRRMFPSKRIDRAAHPVELNSSVLRSSLAEVLAIYDEPSTTMIDKRRRMELVLPPSRSALDDSHAPLNLLWLSSAFLRRCGFWGFAKGAELPSPQINHFFQTGVSDAKRNQCRILLLENTITPSFLRQKCANMPTSTQQVERHSFRFPGPFAH